MVLMGYLWVIYYNCSFSFNIYNKVLLNFEYVLKKEVNNCSFFGNLFLVF